MLFRVEDLRDLKGHLKSSSLTLTRTML